MGTKTVNQTPAANKLCVYKTIAHVVLARVSTVKAVAICGVVRPRYKEARRVRYLFWIVWGGVGLWPTNTATLAYQELTESLKSRPSTPRIQEETREKTILTPKTGSDHASSIAFDSSPPAAPAPAFFFFLLRFFFVALSKIAWVSASTDLWEL